MPQATAAFSAPDVVAASAHRAISDEEWTVPVDFLAHDKWSLGCLLSFVLSGCCAFDRPSNQSGVPPSQPSLEEVFADVQRRQKEWVRAIFLACASAGHVCTEHDNSAVSNSWACHTAMYSLCCRLLTLHDCW